MRNTTVHRRSSSLCALVALAHVLAASSLAFAQTTPHAGMLRYPDVSADSIVFVFADDLWIVPRGGGLASPLASPPGAERSPKFSFDGRTIAFVGSYDGGTDLYTVPVDGGVPARVTYHPGRERLSDWTRDGRLLFFTSSFAGRSRQDQLYVVSPLGGLPERLPPPYGTFGTLDETGKKLAYTPNSIDDATWKRYRGGMATDVWVLDLETKTSKRVTEWEGIDTQPMWHKGKLWYLTDEGPKHRLNIWAFDPETDKRHQVTRYEDYDVKWPSIGPGPAGQGEIVFQHGAVLELLDLATELTTTVQVRIPGARPTLKRARVDAAKFVTSWDLSPSGKRALVAARGDVWTVPAKDGTPRNTTRTNGVAERDPAWSPDGLSIAYFSDASGEYELYVAAADGKSEPRRVTKDAHCFRAQPAWSPDSKFLTFTDKTGSLFVVPAAGGDASLVDHDPWAGDLLPEPPSWSHDSRWLAYTRSDERSQQTAIWLYEVQTGAKHQVTAAFFGDSSPVFDRVGDWLYFKSSREFEPSYGEIDTTFVYASTQVLLAVPLRADVKSPFAPKSDEETGAKAAEKDEKGAESKGVDPKANDEGAGDAKAAAKKPREKVEIELAGFERRAIRVPVERGVFGDLAVVDGGALLFDRQGPRGSEEPAKLCVYDPAADKPEEKTLLEDVDGFVVSADGHKVLALQDDGASILDAKADAKPEKLSTDGMETWIDPREEWRQVLQDAWRIERDWFYDPNMHGVSWDKVRDRYAALLPDCVSRGDVAYVLREMISELNVGHAYYSDAEGKASAPAETGLLGCDWRLDEGAWRITRLYEGAAWDVDARNPLVSAAVQVGEFVLAVNGVPLDAKRDPWASFTGLAEKVVLLTVSKTAKLDGAVREVVVKTLANETELRYRAWIEEHRSYVDRKSAGKVGYIYVPSTGVNGQNDLVRQFFGQVGKEALIVDERWNDGGQIPTRFIELLNRPLTNYWARRDAKDWPWPPDAHQGPKCMLINGMSGSGGDAFPAYFRQAKLGPLIGTRTWGGLVGLSGNPAMIDGSTLSVPSFGYYDKDGTWGIEGHGVDPDIVVLDDPALMLEGGDPQLDKAIEVMLAEIAKNPYAPPARPAYPDRSGMGLPESDK